MANFQRLFRRDAETNTRDACATKNFALAPNHALASINAIVDLMAFSGREMAHAVVLCLTAMVFVLPNQLEGATSDWLFVERPKFPANALKSGSEGSVKLRIVLNSDGSVRNSTVTKSSGDPVLDVTAQKSVLNWQMKRSAIKPSDLTKGRETIVEFKQQAMLAAVYPDRQAYFSSWEDTDRWMYAPFPSYPLEARRSHHAGTVLLYFRLGNDGRVAIVQKVQSSGYDDLDQAAITALRLWRAHKQYAGQEGKVPIRFVLSRHH